MDPALHPNVIPRDYANFLVVTTVLTFLSVICVVLRMTERRARSGFGLDD